MKIIIIGATSGLGRGVVEILDKQGHTFSIERDIPIGMQNNSQFTIHN